MIVRLYLFYFAVVQIYCAPFYKLTNVQILIALFNMYLFYITLTLVLKEITKGIDTIGL